MSLLASASAVAVARSSSSAAAMWSSSSRGSRSCDAASASFSFALQARPAAAAVCAAASARAMHSSLSARASIIDSVTSKVKGALSTATSALSSSTERLSAAPEQRDALAQEKAVESYWKKFAEMMMKPNFNLQHYEDICKLQIGEAASEATLFDKARAAIGGKVRQMQKQEVPAELKRLLAMLKEFTPEEKANVKLVTAEVEKRVAAACKQERTDSGVGEVKLMLARFDQFASMSEWWQWRARSKQDLPESMQDMWDMMRTDKRERKPYPRESSMDERHKKVQQPRALMKRR